MRVSWSPIQSNQGSGPYCSSHSSPRTSQPLGLNPCLISRSLLISAGEVPNHWKMQHSTAEQRPWYVHLCWKNIEVWNREEIRWGKSKIKRDGDYSTCTLALQNSLSLAVSVHTSRWCALNLATIAPLSLRCWNKYNLQHNVVGSACWQQFDFWKTSLPSVQTKERRSYAQDVLLWVLKGYTLYTLLDQNVKEPTYHRRLILLIGFWDSTDTSLNARNAQGPHQSDGILQQQQPFGHYSNQPPYSSFQYGTPYTTS